MSKIAAAYVRAVGGTETSEAECIQDARLVPRPYFYGDGRCEVELGLWASVKGGISLC